MSESNYCLFCRIIADKIPATMVYVDDIAVAIRDINPQAPVHLLIIPKKHLASFNQMTADDEIIIGHLSLLAANLARQEGIADSGYRTVVNTGPDAQQSVQHIHLHLLGGREMTWPPG